MSKKRISLSELSQTTDTIVMVAPAGFGFNEETAATNRYQHRPDSEEQTKRKAMKEFDMMVQTLRNHGITVWQLPSDPNYKDAVFPNNWFSHHRTEKDEILVLYPMAVINRRAERQPEAIMKLLGNEYLHISDLTSFEQQGIFLEGTGSLILDRVNNVAYAIESPRTMKSLFDLWLKRMGYDGVFFEAFDTENPPYHTNIIMAICSQFAVLAPDLIAEKDRKNVIDSLKKAGKEVISITSKQVSQFCGNIIELHSKTGAAKIVLSESAFYGFTKKQRETLSQFGELIPVAIPTIENVGGGSARCMIAEVFPSK